mmetsp:Transcript_18485/g.62366  ORF Transcript_18485/g.62366 Transcript_18485/m.62366 type:complete len:207 (-) Transcript_18485:405-1025(-)
MRASSREQSPRRTSTPRSARGCRLSWRARSGAARSESAASPTPSCCSATSLSPRCSLAIWPRGCTRRTSSSWRTSSRRKSPSLRRRRAGRPSASRASTPPASCTRTWRTSTRALSCASSSSPPTARRRRLRRSGVSASRSKRPRCATASWRTLEKSHNSPTRRRARWRSTTRRCTFAAIRENRGCSRNRPTAALFEKAGIALRKRT